MGHGKISGWTTLFLNIKTIYCQSRTAKLPRCQVGGKKRRNRHGEPGKKSVSLILICFGELDEKSEALVLTCYGEPSEKIESLVLTCYG